MDRDLRAVLPRLHTAPCDWVSLKITPDKLLTNDNVEQLAKSLWEMYATLADRVRIDRDGLHYRRPDLFSWEAELGETIRFRLCVPSQWADYAREHLSVCWPHATVTQDTSEIDADKVAYLRLKRHYYLSLQIHPQSLDPVRGLCLLTEDIRPGEKAWVQLLCMPEADSWAIPATEAYERARAGEFVAPAHMDAKAYAQEGLYQTACVLQGALDIVVETITGQDTETKLPRSVRLPGQQVPSHHTRDKLGKSAFQATIRLAVKSPDVRRREAIIRTLAVAFRGCAGDNELARVDVPPNRKSFVLGQMRGRVLPRDWMTLSTAEVGSLMKLPPAVIQTKFVESLAFREGRPPEALTAGGLALGRVTHKGETLDVYWPTGNHDELCLPRCLPGGMGSGKSTAAANFGISAADAGYSVFACSVDDGRMCDLIRDGVKDERRLKIIDLGQFDYPIGLDWHESARGVDAMNRLSAECASYFSRWVDETGGRTRRWLRAAAKAAYSLPGSTLLEVVLMLLSAQYRSQVVPGINDPMLREIWEGFDTMSDGQQRQYVDPVLHRIDYLLDDDALKHILCQPSRPEVDFRKWADDGSVVLIRAPKNKLGDAATDAIMSFIVRKIWLAILTRQDTPLEKRRPCFLLMDEPHQYMSGSAALWESMSVEARQWRLGLVWMFHSMGGQFPQQLRRIIEAAGPHYLLLASGKETYEELEAELKPYTVEEALRTPAHWGIARVRAGGNVVEPFLMALPPEPKRLADRSRLNLEHAKRFGRPVSEVETDILRRERVIYQAMMGGAKSDNRAKPRSR